MSETLIVVLSVGLLLALMLLTVGLAYLLRLLMKQNQTLTNLLVSGDPLVFSTLQQTTSEQFYAEPGYISKADEAELTQYEKLTGDKDDNDRDIAELGLNW